MAGIGLWILPAAFGVGDMGVVLGQVAYYGGNVKGMFNARGAFVFENAPTEDGPVPAVGWTMTVIGGCCYSLLTFWQFYSIEPYISAKEKAQAGARLPPSGGHAHDGAAAYRMGRAGRMAGRRCRHLELWVFRLLYRVKLPLRQHRPALLHIPQAKGDHQRQTPLAMHRADGVQGWGLKHRDSKRPRSFLSAACCASLPLP